MKGAPIAVEGIGKRYDSVTAVDSVSLAVHAGEFVSLLGPSGSGKTTLLMMIAGFEYPSHGVIRIGERDVTNVPPNRRDVGMVFQRYALFPHLTVARNIAYPLRMRGIAGVEIGRRVDEALSMVRLEGYGERMPHQLSGGQQQRVAVARALVFEPPVLLMDEPLGALDKKLREQMQIEIKRLQQSLSVTVLYVTHDQEEALTMSDRVAVMNAGRLVQIGAPAELYNCPSTPFAADFIGKMNFIDGHCAGTTETTFSVRLANHQVVKVPIDRLRGAALPVNGAPIKLAIRPEQVRLAPRGHDISNALPGEIETAIFAGSFETFLVRTLAEATLHVQIPAGGSSAPFRRGDAVDIVLDPSALHVFADQAG